MKDAAGMLRSDGWNWQTSKDAIRGGIGKHQSESAVLRGVEGGEWCKQELLNGGLRFEVRTDAGN